MENVSFIAYTSDERWFYYQFSLPHFYKLGGDAFSFLPPCSVPANHQGFEAVPGACWEGEKGAHTPQPSPWGTCSCYRKVCIFESAALEIIEGGCNWAVSIVKATELWTLDLLSGPRFLCLLEDFSPSMWFTILPIDHVWIQRFLHNFICNIYCTINPSVVVFSCHRLAVERVNEILSNPCQKKVQPGYYVMSKSCQFFRCCWVILVSNLLTFS